MNSASITRESLLQVAEKIVMQDGLNNLNIRRVAHECNISVGSIYNYFPSKAELIFALIENFWNNIFHTSMCNQETQLGFADFINITYQRFSIGLKGFTADFLNQMSMLNYQEKAKGRELEENYWHNMKMGLLQTLEQDQNINPKVWTKAFTKIDFVDFVFSNMMTSLRKAEPNCDFLIKVINRILYKQDE